MTCPFCGGSNLDTGTRGRVGARGEGQPLPRGSRVYRCYDCPAEWFTDPTGKPVRMDQQDEESVE